MSLRSSVCALEVVSEAMHEVPFNEGDIKKLRWVLSVHAQAMDKLASAVESEVRHYQFDREESSVCMHLMTCRLLLSSIVYGCVFHASSGENRQRFPTDCIVFCWPD